MQKGSITTYL